MNRYNPHIHHRKSIRLKGYDYAQAGLYFITICCERRGNPSRLPFGQIENDEMILNEFGTIAYNEWAKLPERFPNFELDVFQIMPNHMHGIILLHDVRAGVRAGFTPAPNNTPGNTVGAGFTPALNEMNIQKGQPQGLPLRNVGDNDRATARVAPTIGNIVGAYKSLVTNACIDICNQKNIRLGKLWQRNYHEHIIRDEQSYHTISNYIINNPKNWNNDTLR